MFASLIRFSLRKYPFSQKERVSLLNELVSTTGALPLHATITEDGGVISIKGVPLTGEYAVKVRENASAALHNVALQAVDEQTLYLAVSQGIHMSQNFDQTLFAKAAVWVVEQRKRLLEALAQERLQELDPKL
jgi:hypothetical protein